MTILPQRLRAGGYKTHMSGKWHCGARSTENLPINRGFDSHFGFLKGGEDHFNQHSGDAGMTYVDLWRDHAPAYGENGTFSTFIYAGEAVRIIEAHANNSAPLFMYLAWHAVHTPLEAPPGVARPVPQDTKSQARSKMNALVHMLDQGIANVTAALRRTGLWDTTLVFFAADNGGWIQNDFGGN
eukprot:Hpha_TRINITY_DN16031_c1_g1::TRINITY_DN16031_c1_g1_i2::g.118267::m.118267/K12375/ARSI_J; arylsulfatase I/J